MTNSTKENDAAKDARLIRILQPRLVVILRLLSVACGFTLRMLLKDEGPPR